MPTSLSPSSAQPDCDVQELVAAYKVLDLELSASSYAIEHWYRELSLPNQPDRCRQGSPEQHRVAEKRRRIEMAYELIRSAPLRDHPLAKATAALEADRVRDPGLAIDRTVSVATETVARLGLGVAVGLLLAYFMYRKGVPGFGIYVWFAPFVVGILFMLSLESTGGLLAFVFRRL
jgi:preprotein translocase subunit Sec63